MSAIQGMMSLLQPEPPEGGYGEGIYPQGLLQPTPGFGGPSQQAKPPSMVERILDRFRPKAPAGYEGLLSQEEIQGARPGLLQSLIGTPDAPSASERYRGNLNNIVAVKQAAEEMRAQKQLGEARAKIAGKYRLPQNATRDQQIEALRGMMADYAAIGDHEMVGKMAGYMSGADKAPGSGEGPEWMDMGGEKWFVDQQGNVLKKEPKTPSPRNTNEMADNLRDQRMFAREQQLADDFNKDTTPTREMAQKVAGAVAEADRAKAGDGVAQVNMLYAFISAMDPGTAVREGEIGLVRSAGSLVQQAQGLLAKYTQGQAVTVPPAMVDAMANLMRRRLEGAEKYVRSRVNYYRNRAQRWGVEGDSFPELEIPEFTPAAPTKSGGAVKNSIGGIR